MSVIPLPTGEPHLRFTVNLGGVRLRVKLDWLERWGYYHVTLLRDEEVLRAGLGLHPDVDLLFGLGLGVGALYLRGQPATPNNLGNTNELVYEP